MKYYVVKQLTNTAGQDGSSISVYDSLDKAKVGFHGISQSLFNAPDVYFAVVQILNEIGTRLDIETIDKRPQPEPESEPEQSSIVPE